MTFQISQFFKFFFTVFSGRKNVNYAQIFSPITPDKGVPRDSATLYRQMSYHFCVQSLSGHYDFNSHKPRYTLITHDLITKTYFSLFLCKILYSVPLEILRNNLYGEYNIKNYYVYKTEFVLFLYV